MFFLNFFFLFYNLNIFPTQHEAKKNLVFDYILAVLIRHKGQIVLHKSPDLNSPKTLTSGNMVSDPIIEPNCPAAPHRTRAV